MDIGSPTNIRHVTHVIFDRLQGFLGLPMEFELEVPRRVPSASASAFGVSAESMQCSFDAYGNSVPTILLLLQERLYEQGGLKTEGIFRINPDNSKEEQLREQLNKGIVPYDIDAHCLAGLIKAWFRELPKGVLDSLSPEQVMQCHTEDECIALVKTLPPTQSALFDWAINLMVDVVQEEASNKMNARNIAVVFAPNMTQMLDPLTALKHAVQVMNLLKTLILKTLKDRERSVVPTTTVTWDESLAEAKEKRNNTTVQAVDLHVLKEGAALHKASREDSLRGVEARDTLTAGQMKSSTKAFANTEIVEEIGSPSGSEWSSLTYSSRRGSGDEDNHSIDDHGRLVEQWDVWDNAYGDGVIKDIDEGKFGQSQPFAYLLRKVRSPAAKSKHGDEHVLNVQEPCLNRSGIKHGDEHVLHVKEPCLNRSGTLRNVHPTQFRDNHLKKQSGQESKWGGYKPLADWLHRESSPAIRFRLLEEATLGKDEKPKIKISAMEKPARLDCRARVSHPLSKRTHHLRNNGMV